MRRIALLAVFAPLPAEPAFAKVVCKSWGPLCQPGTGCEPKMHRHAR